jgi:chorismate mutase
MSVKLNLEPFHIDGIDNTRPLVMAGPCSAETEEQVMETARQLKAHGVNIYRAGIWKPRTRPNSFEGVGKKGLLWLKKVQKEVGMLTATEVANASHVFDALKYGVDILWIGARTTANPFAVQEIADALEGTDIPVLIKNPVNPDVELWIGAFERINQAGIKKLAAIHRGFSSYDKSPYRNAPQWQIPIELKRRIPELPILVDPSHICGNRELLYEVSQKGMDLNFDGLIVESHVNPDKAISDARQQLTPDALKQMLDRLVLRSANVDSPISHTLEELRAAIDKYDNQLLDILADRMKVAEKIGQYKKEHNLTILQSGRWDSLINERTEKAKGTGLSEEFLMKILRAIHQESINHQTSVMND